MSLPQAWINDSVRRALAEDLGVDGDLTTKAAGLAERSARARLIAKDDGVLAGLDIAKATFRACDPDCVFLAEVLDGAAVTRGATVLEVGGEATALLQAERTALNFLQRLSGTATRTRALVRLVEGTGARILETRKTTPGLRLAEKYAVVVGGGTAHREGLYDQVLLKENHFAVAAPKCYREVVECAVRTNPTDKPVIAEARDLDEARAAVLGGAGVVMLDNFEAGSMLTSAIEELRAIAEAEGRTVEFEASGGIDEHNVRAYAECGVDRISIGALTHSVRAFDLSMLLELQSVEATAG